MEELLLQHKTLKEIAEFLNLSEMTVANSQTRNRPKPSEGSYNDLEYEDRLLAQPSDGSWMDSIERHISKEARS
tara:strand:- start:228 stop:449 length:222 start_codon:yes stop_codon:yes gene_type:complete